MQGSRFQQISENPLLNVAAESGSQIHEPDATLPGRCGPHDLPASFHAEFGIAQLEADADFLHGMNRGDRLHGKAFAGQVANDAAIRLIKGDVGQGTKFVPMLGPSLSRERCPCVHTHHRSCSARNTLWLEF